MDEIGNIDSKVNALEALYHLNGRESSETLGELFLDATESREVLFTDFELDLKLKIAKKPKKNDYVEQLTRILNFIDEIWPRILADTNTDGLSWLHTLKDLDSLIEKIEKNLEGYNCEKNPIKKLRKHYGQMIARANTAFGPKSQRPNLPQVPRTNPSTSSSAVAKMHSLIATPAINSHVGADAAPFYNVSGADQVNHLVSESIFVSSNPIGTSTMSAENSSDEDKEIEKVNKMKEISHNQYNIQDNKEEEEKEEEEEEAYSYFTYGI